MNQNQVSTDATFTPEGGWKPVPRDLLKTLLAGCAGIEERPGGLCPWRLAPALRPFIHEDLLPRALGASGVRLSLQTGATALRARLACVPLAPPYSEAKRRCDVFIDGVLAGGADIPDNVPDCLLIRCPGGGEKRIDVYFPTHRGVLVESLDLPEGETCAAPAPREKWLTHGSSITHCAAAESPGLTWPALVAREKEWDFWNLGFGGQCKFDPVVARTLARMPADRISLCLGINTVSDSYSPRTWRPAVEGFLMILRDHQPRTPLLVISPILSPPREEENGEPGRIALKTMRRMLEEIVARFQAAGDAHIHYLDGLKLIGPGDEEHMPDQLHPNAQGVRLLAQRFLRHIPAVWAG